MKEFNLPRTLSHAIFLLCLVSISRADSAKQSDVPMTRPEQCIAVVDGIGSAASFAELADGSILISRGKGTFSVSKDGGLTWSPPFEGKDASGDLKEEVEGSLVRLSGNSIGLASRVRQGALQAHSRFWRSEDGGKTWGASVRITPPMPFYTGGVNDVLLRTSSGRLVYPVYGHMTVNLEDYTPRMRGAALGGLRNNMFISTEAHTMDPSFTWVYVCYSDDEGKTWSTNRGTLYIVPNGAERTHKVNEPTVAEVEPGKLLMFMRTPLGRLYKSWSLDNGETWTVPAPTTLASGYAPAQLRKIPGTGDLLVVWTQQSRDEIRKGYVRARTSSAVSRTNGAIWEFFQNVESALEGTRAEPGPLEYVRPEGVFYGPMEPAVVRDATQVVDLPATYGRFSYPGVFFYRDRVIITHSNAHFDSDDKYIIPGRLKVLPISWLYAGAKNMKPDPQLKKMFPIRRD